MSDQTETGDPTGVLADSGCPIHDFAWHPPENCPGCPIHPGDGPPVTCNCTPQARQLQGRLAALKRAHVALAEQAGQHQAALARVHRLADLIAAGAPWAANRDDLARRIREAASIDDGQAATGATEGGDTRSAAHGDGPTVREAADNDRRWPLEKAGE